MRLSNDELRADLQTKMEAILDELLSDKSHPGEIDLSEIEQRVQAAGEEGKEELTAGLVRQASEEERSAMGPVCGKCGQPMHYKGPKEKYVETETGAVKVKRAYYYCTTCRTGIFPPGPTVATGSQPV